MTTRKVSEYELARIAACRGKRVSLREEGHNWGIEFVPLGNGRCREVGLSVSGHMREGFVWAWDGETLTIEAEKNEKGTKVKNPTVLDS